MNRPLRPLFDLARFHGVQTGYIDAFGERQHVNVDALLAVLRSLGVGIEAPEQAAKLLLRGQRERWASALEPCVVAWEGEGGFAELRVAASATGTVSWVVTTEAEDVYEYRAELGTLAVASSRDLDGQQYAGRKLPLPVLPLGYHRVDVTYGGRVMSAFVIAAPRKAYQPAGRSWGVFAPLFSLHDETSWGSGDTADLRRFAGWVDRQGGDFVATLPLLPMFLKGNLFSQSPYSPVSRLFWNELYVDVEAALRHFENEGSLEPAGLEALAGERERLRGLSVIDYRAVAALKRQVLSKLPPTDVPPAANDPLLHEYALFRAVCESTDRPWGHWPEHMRTGHITPGDADPATVAYFATSQQVIKDQLAQLSVEMGARGQQVYLDLPVGCHADGFDSWKYQSQFAPGMQCGAPPDLLFTLGQAWGLPPMVPDAMRRSGYEYLRATLKHHLQFADILRYDHVIGLHRLYWVADGFSAREGIFVQYPAEELYAVLCLESHRAQAVIVGENLGTVPKHINASLARHGILETYVMQFEIPGDASKPMRPPPARSFAGLNTHDTPTFAAFLQGLDIDRQVELGIRDASSAEGSKVERTEQVAVLCLKLEEAGLLDAGDREPQSILRAAHRWLSGSAAKYMVVNLEDLWLEIEGHNVPGTAEGNWERPIARTQDQFPAPREMGVVRGEPSTG